MGNAAIGCFVGGILGGGFTCTILIALLLGIEGGYREEQVDNAFRLGLEEGKRQSKIHN